MFLEEAGAFAAGEFQVVNVFDNGGERSPQLLGRQGSTSWPSSTSRTTSLVEVAPLVAAARPSPVVRRRRPCIDTSRPHQYVYMIRDLGAKRQPAAFITIGSLVVFLLLLLAAAHAATGASSRTGRPRPVPAKA